MGIGSTSGRSSLGFQVYQPRNAAYFKAYDKAKTAAKNAQIMQDLYDTTTGGSSDTANYYINLAAQRQQKAKNDSINAKAAEIQKKIDALDIKA